MKKQYRATSSEVCTETKNIVDAQTKAEEREREEVSANWLYMDRVNANHRMESRHTINSHFRENHSLVKTKILRKNFAKHIRKIYKTSSETIETI